MMNEDGCRRIIPWFFKRVISEFAWRTEKNIEDYGDKKFHIEIRNVYLPKDNPFLYHFNGQRQGQSLEWSNKSPKDWILHVSKPLELSAYADIISHMPLHKFSTLQYNHLSSYRHTSRCGHVVIFCFP